MFISARMKKIQVLTLLSDEPNVTEAIGEMGLLHLTRAPAEGGTLPVEGPQSRQSETHLEALETRAEGLCRSLGIDTRETPQAAVPHPSIKKVEGQLEEIEAEVGTIIADRDKLNTERKQIEKLLHDTSSLPYIDAPLEDLANMSFLHFAIGSMTGDSASSAEKELGDRAIVLPYTTPFGENKVIAISSKKGRWALESSLEKHGFRRDELPVKQKGLPARITQLAEQRLGNLVGRTKEINAAAKSAAERHRDQLLAIRHRLRTEHRIAEARHSFAHTEATMLITGWVPAEKVNTLCETVLDVTDHRTVIEVRDPRAEAEEPPTLMKNHPLIRPFEMLVSSYSTPHYDEIEPTPFMAVLFLLMFGVMFGDVGHSALLLVAGIMIWVKGRGKIHDAGVIITFCSISGIIFGLLYGSVFGFEQFAGHEFGVLPRLRNARFLLALTVLFGVATISLGMVLNIINRLRRREYLEVSLDKFGIVGGIFYWGSLAIAARGVVTGGRVSVVAVLLLIIAPLVIIFAHRPLTALLHRHKQQQEVGAEGMFIMLIESAAEAFETVLVFAANTLSFARLGAFALAHVGLCLAVFELIEIVRGLPGAPVWTALIFVLGTLFIVLLEGFIVAIQSLRLEYYEFFSKFFRGEGRGYKPFSLKT